jgi:hypothetical protein
MYFCILLFQDSFGDEVFIILLIFYATRYSMFGETQDAEESDGGAAGVRSGIIPQAIEEIFEVLTRRHANGEGEP